MSPRLVRPTSFYKWTSSCPQQCLLQDDAVRSWHRIVRDFSTTRYLSDSIVNHYQILQISPECSPAELKKCVSLQQEIVVSVATSYSPSLSSCCAKSCDRQFYTLSRTTHPDINKSDPEASDRFSQISESYSTLADPERRRRYDRDIFRVHFAPSSAYGSTSFQSQRSGTGQAHRSDGHGGSYVGSRPASGLSRRRGTFRGPPPSFYAQGGTGGSFRPRYPTSSSTASSTSNASHTEENLDFDPTPISRTQAHEDRRRHTRRQAAQLAAAQEDAEEQKGFWARFAVVSALLIGGFSVGGIFLGSTGSGGALVNGEGRKRN